MPWLKVPSCRRDGKAPTRSKAGNQSKSHENGSAARPAAGKARPVRAKKCRKARRRERKIENMLHLPERRGSVRRPDQARGRGARQKKLKCRKQGLGPQLSPESTVCSPVHSSGRNARIFIRETLSLYACQGQKAMPKAPPNPRQSFIIFLCFGRRETWTPYESARP